MDCWLSSCVFSGGLGFVFRPVCVVGCAHDIIVALAPECFRLGGFSGFCRVAGSWSPSGYLGISGGVFFALLFAGIWRISRALSLRSPTSFVSTSSSFVGRTGSYCVVCVCIFRCAAAVVFRMRWHGSFVSTSSSFVSCTGSHCIVCVCIFRCAAAVVFRMWWHGL